MVSPNTVIDFGHDGKIVALEIMDASHYFRLNPDTGLPYATHHVSEHTPLHTRAHSPHTHRCVASGVYYAESDRFEVCFGASTAGEGEAGEEQPVDDDFSHISVVKATTDGKVIAMRIAQALSYVSCDQ
jgi:uncharacterized protein YuzE